MKSPAFLILAALLLQGCALQSETSSWNQNSAGDNYGTIENGFTAKIVESKLGKPMIIGPDGSWHYETRTDSEHVTSAIVYFDEKGLVSRVSVLRSNFVTKRLY